MIRNGEGGGILMVRDNIQRERERERERERKREREDNAHWFSIQDFQKEESR